MSSVKKISFAYTLESVLFLMVLYSLGVIILGVSIFPGVYFLYALWSHTASVSLATRLLYFCFGFVAGYFFSGAMLMLLVSLVTNIFRLRLKEGEYKVGSSEIFKWIFVNAFFMAVKVAFMDFILLTPYCALFYRWMGAKIGRNVVINSKNVSDLSLLEIGANSVIGGNATIIAHSLERDGLKLKKVKIGKNVVVGLNAVIFPGVDIEDNALIAAGAIVPKDTLVREGVVFCVTGDGQKSYLQDNLASRKRFST